MVHDAKTYSSGSTKSHKLSIVTYQLLNSDYLTKVCLGINGSKDDSEVHRDRWEQASILI